MVFTGTYQRSLDGKFRVLLPKRLRDEVGETETLYLTPGTDQCLELHTQQSLNELASRVNQSTAGSRNLKSFARLFYAQAEQCDVDGQGRLRIPKELADFAKMTKEIVIVGVGFNFEIWDQHQWTRYLTANEAGFDEIVQATFDGNAMFQPINSKTNEERNSSFDSSLDSPQVDESFEENQAPRPR